MTDSTFYDKLPRGLRCNNPGNIRKNDTRWLGEVADARGDGVDPSFEEFDTLDHGCRALAKVLLHYQKVFRANRKTVTVANIIQRWAPPTENDTVAYACHVAAQLGIGILTPLDLGDPAILEKLCAAIARHENGVTVDPEAIRRGVEMALS